MQDIISKLNNMNKQELIDEKIRWDTRYHKEAQEKINNGYDYKEAIRLEIQNGIEFDEKPAPEERSTTCYHCGELVPPEQVIKYRGERICPSCYDELWFGSSVKDLKINL